MGKSCSACQDIHVKTGKDFSWSIRNVSWNTLLLNCLLDGEAYVCTASGIPRRTRTREMRDIAAGEFREGHTERYLVGGIVEAVEDDGLPVIPV